MPTFMSNYLTVNICPVIKINITIISNYISSRRRSKYDIWIAFASWYSIS